MSRFLEFVSLLRSYGTQRCIEDGDTAYTYADLWREIELWRDRLDGMHVTPGTVIGIRADYSLAAIAALLGLLDRGAVAALIPRDRDPGCFLNDAHAGGYVELSTEGTYEWQPLSPPASHPLLERLRSARDGGMVIFTSGSTGPPKAALLSLERFLYKFSRAGRRLRTLAFLLFDHIAGMDTLFYTLANGGALVLTRRRDPRSILDVIEAHQVEVLPTSPTFLRLLCVAEASRTRDLSSLKVITYGSETMDPDTLARLNVRFPNAQIIQKYGTTETGAPRSTSRGNDSLWLKITSADVEMKVIDDLLWVRSEGTMLGYLNAATPIDNEGWYCTGDLVDVDGEWIRFRGRASDTINVGGEKVAPTEVEQSILELDFVREVSVWGEPHDLVGRIVCAQVALSTSGLSAKDAISRIRKHCRARLASYKVPVKIEIVTGSLSSDRQKRLRSHARDR